MMPIDGRISGSLIFQNCARPVMPSHLGRLDHLVGDRRAAPRRSASSGCRRYCQTEISDERGQRVLLLAEPGREQPLQPDRARAASGDTPQIGDRISFQAKPTMTKDSMVGMKIAVR